MDKLLGKSLSSNEIFREVGDRCNIWTNKMLSKLTSIEQMFVNHDVSINDGDRVPVVLLYETEPYYGHYVTVIMWHPEVIEVFDPYGCQIDEELNFIHPSYADEITAAPHLTRLLRKHRARFPNLQIISNKIKLQDSSPDIATCGRWAIMRILSYFKGMNLTQFINTFNVENPDLLVTMMTSFI